MSVDDSSPLRVCPSWLIFQSQHSERWLSIFEDLTATTSVAEQCVDLFEQQSLQLCGLAAIQCLVLMLDNG